MSLSECEKCGGHVPLGPSASNRCERCGEHVMGIHHDEIDRLRTEVERLLISVKGYDKALSDAAAHSEQQDREVWSLRDEVERLRALCARQPLIDRIVTDLERMVYYFRKPADQVTGDPLLYACEEAEKDLALYAAGRGEGLG